VACPRFIASYTTEEQLPAPTRRSLDLISLGRIRISFFSFWLLQVFPSDCLETVGSVLESGAYCIDSMLVQDCWMKPMLASLNDLPYLSVFYPMVIVISTHSDLSKLQLVQECSLQSALQSINFYSKMVSKPCFGTLQMSAVSGQAISLQSPSLEDNPGSGLCSCSLCWFG